jgi:predicted lipoprotein with Yx(FWY)xxD motif
MSLLLFALAAAAVPADVAAVGKPIYTFDRDEPGKSNCVDRCAAAWPPVAASADAKPVGNWTVITRPDGSSQWAIDGKPVYTFVRDTGTTATGDGMNGWHVVKVD